MAVVVEQFIYVIWTGGGFNVQLCTTVVFIFILLDSKIFHGELIKSIQAIN